MKCPLFEEVIMAYCTACSKKKMIAKDQLTMQNPCEADHGSCAIYQTFLASQEKETAKQTAREKPLAKEVKASEKEKPCIWMKAGVIAYRMCTRNYDCKSCEFDQVLLDQGGNYQETPLVVQAIEKMRQLPASAKKCRYMLTGDFSYKLCSNNYECWHCAVDQYIQDVVDADPYLKKRRERAAKKEKTVKGFTIREDFFYLPNHIWVKVEGDAVKVGIDDFAARLIGKIEKINFSDKAILPKGSACWSMGSGRRMVSMTLPMSSEIVEVNREVRADPQIVQKSPYNKGWLLKMKKPAEMGDLLKGAKAEEWLEKEFEKLHQEFESSIGVTISDGGDVVDNLFEQLDDEEWNELIKRFLG